MLNKILDFIEKNELIPKGSSVICALSGGIDSVVLLHCLNLLSERLDISIEALHVNHCIRGDESDRDENFCRSLCLKENIVITAVRCNVPSFAREKGISVEEAARILRYKVFEEKSAGKFIATAHNADDNLETLINNITRGTALKGLSGIPPKRGNIIRPLLHISRKEIEHFAQQNGLEHVTDSTNLSDEYTRNKIRHRIIPVMSELNTSLIEKSVSSIDALREENSFIEAEASRVYSKCFIDNALNDIAKYHPLLRKRCIARLLSENALPYSYERLEAADRIIRNSGKINISKNLYFVSDGRSLMLECIEKTDNTELSIPLKFGENSIFDGIAVKAEIVEERTPPRQNVDINTTVYYLDYDKINGAMTLRNRRFGDRIRLAGKDFTSSVKKLINEKIPKDQRQILHFIDDSQGTIFAERLGIADRAAPDSSSSRLLKITVGKKNQKAE